MNEYDALYQEILGLKQDCTIYEYGEEIFRRAVSITLRFEDAGWCEAYSWGAHVRVFDPSGKAHGWCLNEPLQVEDCIKVLKAAEKAAKETKR